MKVKKNIYFSVGIIVLISFGIFVYIVAQLGEYNLKKGFEFNVIFEFANGIIKNAPVMVSGVKLGKVKNISFVTIDKITKVKLQIWLEQTIKLKKNAKIYINQAGLMGEKYVEIDPGTRGFPNVEMNETLIGVEPQKVEEIVKGVNNVVAGLERTIAGFNDVFVEKKVKKQIRNAIGNFSVSLKNLSEILIKNKDNINNGLNEFSDGTKDISKTAKILKDIVTNGQKRFELILKNLDALSSNLNDLSTKNYDSVNEIIKNLKKLTETAQKTFKNSSENIIDLSSNLNSSAKQIDLFLKKKEKTISDIIDNTKSLTLKSSDFIGNADKLIKDNFEIIHQDFLSLQQMIAKISDLSTEVKTTFKNINKSKGVVGLLLNDVELKKKIKQAGLNLSLAVKYIKHHPGIILNKSKYVGPKDYYKLEKRLKKEEKKLRK